MVRSSFPRGEIKWFTPGTKARAALLPLGGWDGEIQSLATARDGLLIVAGDANGVLRYWRARPPGKKPTTGIATGPAFIRSAFPPKAKCWRPAAQDGSVILWDLEKVPGEERRLGQLDDMELEKIWKDMGGNDEEPDTPLAFRNLTYSGRKGYAFIKKNLLVTKLDVEQMTPLFAKLDNENFTEREQAEAELIKRPAVTIPVIEEDVGETSSFPRSSAAHGAYARYVESREGSNPHP